MYSFKTFCFYVLDLYESKLGYLPLYFTIFGIYSTFFHLNKKKLYFIHPPFFSNIGEGYYYFLNVTL